MRILIDTETRTWTNRERDESDEWDNGDTGSEVSNVTARLTDRDVTDYSDDSIVRELPVGPGDTVYAVVADYESGSTFGRNGGYASVLDVFTTEIEAAALALAAAQEPGDDRYAFTYNGETYYRSWEGYFDRLQSMDVWVLVVGGSPQERPYSRKIGH